MNDGAISIVGHRYPVARGRAIDALDFVAQPPRQLAKRRLATEQMVDTRAVGRYPGRDEPRTGPFELVDLGGEKRALSEILESDQWLAPV